MNLPWLSSFTVFAQILLPESFLPLNLNCGNSYGFLWWFHGKNLPASAEEVDLIPGVKISPGEAWEIPWTEEPGRLQSMGSQRVGYNLVTDQQKQQQ